MQPVTEALGVLVSSLSFPWHPGGIESSVFMDGSRMIPASHIRDWACICITFPHSSTYITMYVLEGFSPGPRSLLIDILIREVGI